MKNAALLFFLITFSSAASAQSWHPVITPTQLHIDCIHGFNNKLILTSYGSNNEEILSWDGTQFDTIGLFTGYCSGTWAMEIYNGELYIGGDFDEIDNIIVHGLGRWDGTNWNSVGTGVGGFNGAQVEALKVFNGELYVGGGFTQVNGVAQNHIAKWDGANWDSVGVGFNFDVSAFEIFNNELIAGGYFTMSGIDTISKIARWDGTDWKPLRKGIDSWSNNIGIGYVRSLKTFQNKLYVGGYYLTADTLYQNFISTWDGQYWSNPGFDLPEKVLAMEVYNNKLFIGGSFIIDSLNIHHCVSWDGNNLDDLNGAIKPNYTSWIEQIWDIEAFDGKLFIAGGFDSTLTFYSRGITYWTEPLVTTSKLKTDNTVIRIFPNPATSILNIFTETIEDYNLLVTIKDILGNTIISQKTNGVDLLPINVAQLPSGIYLVEVAGDATRTIKKFVKQ